MAFTKYYFPYIYEEPGWKLLLDLLLSETSLQTMLTWNIRHRLRTHTHKSTPHCAKKNQLIKTSSIIVSLNAWIRRQRWTTLDRSQHYIEYIEAHAGSCPLRKCVWSAELGRDMICDMLSNSQMCERDRFDPDESISVTHLPLQRKVEISRTPPMKYEVLGMDQRAFSIVA